MPSMKKAVLAIALIAASIQAGEEKPKAATIVFVCEHGAAKSIVAAAYFNRLAEQEHLPYRATARATSPQPELAPAATEGLRADGLQAPVERPTKLTKDDIDGAARVVSFCEIPDEVAGGKQVEHWLAPPVGDGYCKSRDVIVERTKTLIESLKRKK